MYKLLVFIYDINYDIKKHSQYYTCGTKLYK